MFIALARRTFKNQPAISLVQEKTRLHLEDLFEIGAGDAPKLVDMNEGDIPVITTTESNNGIKGYYDASGATIWRNAITISANGSGGFACWHPYPFAASADVLVCNWRDTVPKDPALALYICNEINNNSWRFDYYRKCGRGRLLSDVNIGLPMIGDRIDLKCIREEVKRLPGFNAIMEMIKSEAEQEEGASDGTADT